MKARLDLILRGESLKREEAHALMEELISGDVPVEQVGALLVALRMRGETSEELFGFSECLLEKTSFENKYDLLLDVCGTGGDGAGTFNVSTAVALVVASLGVPVAKHGNRGVSSRSGSSDVLEALNLKSDQTSTEANRSLEELGLSFLFAPAFHPVLAKLAQVRKNLGVYTFFNVLGPLLNPAPLTHQMMGVYHPNLLKKVTEVLKKKGLHHAFVVCGEDGLDELTLSGPSHLFRLKNAQISGEKVTPEDFGLKRAPLEQVKGGTPEENANIIEAIFNGEKSAKRDLVILNAAAALVLVEKERNFQDAAQLAARALDSGETLKLFTRMSTRKRSAR